MQTCLENKKTIKGTCRMVTQETSEIKVVYDQALLDFLKIFTTRSYGKIIIYLIKFYIFFDKFRTNKLCKICWVDETSRLWSLNINEHDKFICELKERLPHVLLDEIPKCILDVSQEFSEKISVIYLFIFLNLLSIFFITLNVEREYSNELLSYS